LAGEVSRAVHPHASHRDESRGSQFITIEVTGRDTRAGYPDFTFVADADRVAVFIKQMNLQVWYRLADDAGAI
jgi:hypothetical protein